MRGLTNWRSQSGQVWEMTPVSRPKASRECTEATPKRSGGHLFALRRVIDACDLGTSIRHAALDVILLYYQGFILSCWTCSLNRLCLEALKPHLREDMPLMLTGHSMGGALAVVTALNLNDLGYTVRRVVTWGAPKVGKSECCASCASLDILRVSHADDLVVYLPPTRLTGYCHMGSGLILTSASAPCYAYLSPEERPCAVEALKKVVSVGSDRQLVHRAASHRMARYAAPLPPPRSSDTFLFYLYYLLFFF